MKITKTPDMVRGSIGATNASSIGGVTIGPPSPPSSPGQGIVSSTSNTASWQPIVSTISSGGSVLLGPNVNVAAGSNVTLAITSNTLTISSLGTELDGYWETVTNGDSTNPECVYADGDIVVAFVEA